jgi:hypothetical protein
LPSQPFPEPVGISSIYQKICNRQQIF